jgi:hypothetical protein
MASPYMSLREVADYLRKLDANGQPSVKQARAYVNRYGIKSKTAGRSVLVVRESLEASLEDR